MFKTLHKRRRLLVAATGLLGVSAMMATAIPAGAAVTPAQNTVINGAGSDTTYTMMAQLSELFNTAPGCNLTVQSGGVQQLNYSCADPAQTGAENGFVINYPSLNPYNDVVLEEPALGSGNGIQELLDQSSNPNATGVLAAPSDFARSSRAPKSTDLGLQFVGYAADAVPWFHFTKYGAATPSAKIKSLTLTQLENIYNGVTTNWDQISKGKSAPIDCYMAQSGSGTESTWATDLGLSATPACLNDPGMEQTTGGAATHVIQENEDSSIFPNGDGKDAIYFFSYGKYALLCPKGVCAGTPTADKSDTAALGEINGVTASQTTILNGTFATDRTLYNAYENGSSQNSDAVPVATQNALNFVSSAGFLCNPVTQADVDPLSPTAETYGQEIGAIIKANGFFPLPVGAQGDGSVTGTVKPWTSSSSSTEAQITNNTVSYAGASVTNPFYTADVAPSGSPANNGDQGTCRVAEGS